MTLNSNKEVSSFSRESYYGLEFIWYGVDRIGNIGFFEAGELPIPSKVFNNESLYKELDSFFQNLPQITDSEVTEKMKDLRTASGGEPDFTGFLIEANRGIFYFNEMDTFIKEEYIYGYYLMVKPLKNLHFSNLPERIQERLDLFRFPIIFSDVEKID